jgi:superfamily II DNA or RNA helicase
VIAAEMAKLTGQRGKRTLFIVHRKELVDQTVRAFWDWGVDMSLCDVGMVQTLKNKTFAYSPDLIITDENHHAPANSYKTIYEKYPDAKKVGITATPARLDGSGLIETNDILIENVDVKYLIENNFLAPFDYYAPNIADLTGLRSRNGDYIPSEIEKRLDKSAIDGDVIKYYSDLGRDMQAICYCASINHSENMAEKFNAAGIISAHIDGKTPKYERSKLIKQFRGGEVRILCNVDLISEGFDVPDCGCAILLRPTKSLTLYIQQSMRCMRYKEGKKAVIIDHVGNYARFGLPDMKREWSLEKKDKRKREDEILKVRQCPKCNCVHDSSDESCPNCEFGYGIRGERKLDEVAGELEKITNFKLDYRTADDCQNMQELYEFAKQRGYKPGWAYYKGKARGFI